MVVSTVMATVMATMTVVVLAGGGAGAATPRNQVGTPRSGHNFPDPAVTAYRGGLVAVATGADAPRMVTKAANAPWHRAGRALTRKPGWATGQGVWGVDIARVGDRWLLYFASPVRGLGTEGRCIGVAVGKRPLGRFTPVGRPLVCPRAAHTAPAPDRVRAPSSRLPRRGVIDPSVFRDGKRLYLLYKTQGIPSTIRIVRLTGGGLHAARTSHELIRERHIVENPVLVRHGHRYLMLTSEGSYSSCSYRTVWRTSTRLLRWSTRRSGLLVGRGSGICGPGGADVVVRHAGPVVVFHGWACGRFADRCPTGDNARLQSRRTLYAARLVWHKGAPRLRALPALTHDPDAPTPMIEVTRKPKKHGHAHGKHSKHGKHGKHGKRHPAKRHPSRR